MPGLLIRMFISAMGLWIASELVPGMEITGMGTLVAAAFLLGIVNAVVRPLIVILTFPITIVTLGLFLLSSTRRCWAWLHGSWMVLSWTASFQQSWDHLS